ncbi:hypothetical protein T4D_5121 [Trichinella pseudospiralis]|uniref:Uncharacterized protein n=1 Tax=Trichinella pseudospiralis TaxID=6337 RepID=A0A0V1FPY5_TRIPS|nr:hypothetical protein T4D_5121 [Trichinella pseudospiralis]
MPEKFALQLACVKVINDQVGTVGGRWITTLEEASFVEWCFAVHYWVQMYAMGRCCTFYRRSNVGQVKMIKLLIEASKNKQKEPKLNLQPANRLQQNYKTLYKCLLEDSVGLIRQPGRRKVEQLARQTFTFSYGPLGKVVTPKTLGIFGTVPVCDRSPITRSTLTCSILPHDSLLHSMTTFPKGFSKIKKKIQPNYFKNHTHIKLYSTSSFIGNKTVLTT